MTSSNWKRYLCGALMSGLLIGTALYLADNSHPAMAGMVAAIPLALPTMIFLKENQVKDYSFSLVLGISSYVLSIWFFYYLISQQNISKNKAILISMTCWIALALFAYYLFTSGPYSKNSK